MSLSESFLLTSQPQHALPVASTSSSTIALLSSKILTLFSLKDHSTLATLDVPADAAACATRLVNDQRWIAVASNDEIFYTKAAVKKDGTFSETPNFTSFKTKEEVKAIAANERATFYLNAEGRLFMTSHDFTSSSELSLKLEKPVSSARLSIYAAANSPFPFATASTLLTCWTFHADISNAVTSPKKKGKKQKETSSRTATLSLVSLEGEQMKLLKSIQLPGDQIVDVSIAQSGHITVLQANGEWQHFKLSPSYQLETIRTLRLNDDVHISSTSTHLLPLKASFVLLAAQSKASMEKMTLSLWDLQHGVVLSTSSIQLSSQHSSASLAYGPDLVILSHTNATEARIYGMAVDCPASSTLSLVVGKAALTAPFLQPANISEKREQDEKRRQAHKHPLITSQKSQVVDAAAQSRYDLLDAVLASPSDIDELFDKWLEAQAQALTEYARFKQEKYRRIAQERAAEAPKPPVHQQGRKKQRKGEKEDVQMDEAPVVEPIAGAVQEMQVGETDGHAVEPRSDEDLQPQLPGSFVSQLIALAMDDKTRPLPTKTLSYLIKHKTVSDVYAEGGLAKMLYERKEWDLVQLCLANLQDISEHDLITILKASCAEDADPPLSQVLTRIVQYHTSSKPLRTAMSSQLDLQKVQLILNTIAEWLEKSDEEADDNDVPPLRALVDFLTCLIDAHFIAMLQDESCHKLILRINATLSLAVQETQDWVNLKGPVENLERELKRSLKTDGPPPETGEYTVEVLDI